MGSVGPWPLSRSQRRGSRRSRLPGQGVRTERAVRRRLHPRRRSALARRDQPSLRLRSKSSSWRRGVSLLSAPSLRVRSAAPAIDLARSPKARGGVVGKQILFALGHAGSRRHPELAALPAIGSQSQRWATGLSRGSASSRGNRSRPCSRTPIGWRPASRSARTTTRAMGATFVVTKSNRKPQTTE